MSEAVGGERDVLSPGDNRLLYPNYKCVMDYKETFHIKHGMFFFLLAKYLTLLFFNVFFFSFLCYKVKQEVSFLTELSTFT